MPRTDAQNRADAKYHAKTYKSFTVNMRIPEYETIDDYCRKAGISKNQLILMSCKDWIERHPVSIDSVDDSE